MPSPLEQIREQQKTTWNRFSPGWKKWDTFNMQFLQPMGDAIIDYLDIREEDNVLDIAAGTGEPGLTIAGKARKGTVTGADLAEDMLSIAASNAAARGIHNYATRVADCCELPFADNGFDAISCRMGFMFFPDMELAAREMFRVLKPGGRMAASVWGAPEKNAWIASMTAAISKNIELPPPPPGGPAMFRCSPPGLMQEVLKKSGFINIRQKEITGKLAYDSPDHYWENMMDLAAPVVAILSRSDDTTRSNIKQQLFDFFHSKFPSGPLALEYAAIVLYAEKP